MPFCSMGVMTMKMISSTIMMSAMGVTLMSAMAPPLDPPTAIDMGVLLREGDRGCAPPGWRRAARRPGRPLRALLDEVVEQLRAGVVHLDVEPLHAAGQVVVGPDRGHRHEQAEGGGDEGLGDTGREGGDAARAGAGPALGR